MTIPNPPDPSILDGCAVKSSGAISQCSLWPNLAISSRRTLISWSFRPSIPSNSNPVKLVVGALVGHDIWSASRFGVVVRRSWCSDSLLDSLNSISTRNDFSRTSLTNDARSCSSERRFPKDAAMVSAVIITKFSNTDEKYILLPITEAKRP